MICNICTEFSFFPYILRYLIAQQLPRGVILIRYILHHGGFLTGSKGKLVDPSDAIRN